MRFRGRPAIGRPHFLASALAALLVVLGSGTVLAGTTTAPATPPEPRVQRPGDENQHAAPNHKLLRDIAERTGGTFFAIHDPARPSVASLTEFFGGTPSYKVLEETRLRLRETLPLFLVVLGLLAVEWWWRRRAGLL